MSAIGVQPLLREIRYAVVRAPGGGYAPYATAGFLYARDAQEWVDDYHAKFPTQPPVFTVHELKSGRKVTGVTGHGHAILAALERQQREPEQPQGSMKALRASLSHIPEQQERAERQEPADLREEHENGACCCEFPNECLFEAGYKVAVAEQQEQEAREECLCAGADPDCGVCTQAEMEDGQRAFAEELARDPSDIDAQARVEAERRRLVEGKMSGQEAEAYLSALERESVEMADREVELRLAQAPPLGALDAARSMARAAIKALRDNDEQVEVAGRVLHNLTQAIDAALAVRDTEQQPESHRSVHRCLACGYVGDGGTLLDPAEPSSREQGAREWDVLLREDGKIETWGITKPTPRNLGQIRVREVDAMLPSGEQEVAEAARWATVHVDCESHEPVELSGRDLETLDEMGFSVLRCWIEPGRAKPPLPSGLEGEA